MKCISTVVLCLLLPIGKSDWISFEGADYFFDFETIGDHSFVLDRCAAINSSLAYVTDDKIQEFLAGLANQHANKPYCFYIGLTRTGNTPWFHWSNGANLSAALSHWDVHEPNNKFFKHTGNENCVIMGKPAVKETDFLWHDVTCKKHCSYFCGGVAPQILPELSSVNSTTEETGTTQESSTQTSQETTQEISSQYPATTSSAQADYATSTQSTLPTTYTQNQPITRETKPVSSTVAPPVTGATQKPATTTVDSASSHNPRTTSSSQADHGTNTQSTLPRTSPQNQPITTVTKPVSSTGALPVTGATQRPATTMIDSSATSTSKPKTASNAKLNKGTSIQSIISTTSPQNPAFTRNTKPAVPTKAQPISGSMHKPASTVVGRVEGTTTSLATKIRGSIALFTTGIIVGTMALLL